MQKKTIKYLIAAAAVLTTASASAMDRWIPFNNNGPFIITNFNFNNEQGTMDVAYRPFRWSLSGGFARLQSGRNRGSSAYGVWARTKRIVPIGSYTHARARCEATKDRPNTHNWAAFWTLWDNATNAATKYNYLEHDIMETRTGGAFFNRYTAQNADGSVVTSTGKLLLKDKAWWRNNFREYQCTLGARSSTFSVTGDNFSRTIRGANRRGTSELRLTNRPWGANLGSVGVNTRIADLVVDYIWLDVP